MRSISETKIVRNLIIGGGVSGLSLAKLLDNATVISASSIGGLIANSKKDGFSFDYGGHVYTTADHEVTRLMQNIDSELHKNRKSFFDNELRVPFPVQDHAEMLGLTAQIDEVGADLVVSTSFQGYSEILLGREFTDKFMKPFNQRVWQTPMDSMDYDWVFGRVKSPLEDKEKWGMNSSFYYAKGDDIADRLMTDGLENGAQFGFGRLVQLEEDLHRAIVQQGKRFIEYRYDNVFITCQPSHVSWWTNDVLTIGVGLTHKLDIEEFHWLYPKFGQEIHRVTLLSRYKNDMAPKGSDSLLLEIPMLMMTDLSNEAYMIASSNEAKKNSLVPEVKAMLVKAGFRDAISYDISTIWSAVTLGYPIPFIGHRKAVAERKLSNIKQDVYYAGRWGAHGYYNLQHIFQDAQSVVDAMNGKNLSNYLNANFYYKEPIT